MKKYLVLGMISFLVLCSLKSIDSIWAHSQKSSNINSSESDKICVDPDVVIHFNLDACTSFTGSSNFDYSEFEPIYIDTATCGDYAIVGSHLYRRNPSENAHSCTPGVFNSNAMCIMSADTCAFTPNDDRSIRIDFKLNGKEGEPVIFSGLSFYEQAPLEYNWIQGMSGVNNYPTKYGIRIVKDGEEVFRKSEIATDVIWNEQLFDFTGNAAFTVTDTSLFEIELFPYCLSGIESDVSVWDIDEISILSCCTPCSALGGTLSTEDETNICVNDNIADLITVEISDQVGEEHLIIVTDPTGEILILTNETTLDFENAGLGTCFIQNISWDGILVNLEEGNNICEVFGCYNLSNAIDVVRSQIEASEISTNDETSFCSGDGVDDIVDVEVSGYTNGYNSWLITDSEGLILQTGNPPFNFEGAPTGNCLIWNVTSTEMFDDGVIGLQIDDLTGCYKLSNSITVIRNEVSGGNLTTSDETTICPGDGIADIVTVIAEEAVGDQLIFIVTDLDGSILLVQESNIFDFELADTGICQIWSLALSEMTSIPIAGDNISNIVGCVNLSNPIQIERISVSGGTISTLSQTEICVGDGIDDLIDAALIDQSGDSSAWVITDEIGIIIDLPLTLPFNFEEAPNGNCLVYSMSFNGEIENLIIGNDINEISGCVGLSNSILIQRTKVDGGEISTMDPTIICSGDGISDVIEIELINQIGDVSTYVISDTSGIVIGLNYDGFFDFEGAGPGLSVISHVSSSDSIPESIIGANLDSIIGCYSLSNDILINRTDVVANTISTSSDTSICTGDGADDLIDVELVNPSGDSSVWVITDEIGIILDLPLASPFNFEEAPGGNCLIYSVSFNGEIENLDIGNDINTITGCIGISNSILVQRTKVDGGEISTMDPTTICSGDGVSDIIEIELIDQFGDVSTYVISDTSGIIIGLNHDGFFDFEGAGPGLCVINHISSSDSIPESIIGGNLESIIGCFSLSNDILINRTDVLANEISTTDETIICVGDGISDLINVDLIDNAQANNAWVITSSDSVIISLPIGSPFSFEGAGAGICLIWNVAYGGSIGNFEPGQHLEDLVGCFSLSNSIEVVRTEINGGTIVAINGTIVCIGDGTDSFIEVDVQNNIGNNFTWIISETSGEIIEIGGAPPFNFEGAGAGTCLIWHASAFDEMAFQGVNHIDSLDACVGLSNPIFVVRNEVSSSEISTNSVTSFCVGDGIPDIVEVELDNFSSSFGLYVITNEDGEILDTSSIASFDFEDAGIGTCLIWHVSYEGQILGLEPGFSIDIIAGCFALSNSIEINRTQVFAGTISTNSNTNLCLNIGETHTVVVSSSGSFGDTSMFLLTNELGELLSYQVENEIDFSNAGSGVCFISEIVSIEPIDLSMISNLSDLTGCVALSNQIEVVRTLLEPSVISTMDETNICVGDTIPDILNFDLSGPIEDNSSWLITDTLGNILNVPNAPPFAFTNAGPGVCLVYHINFLEGISGLEEGTNTSNIEGCYVLSNAIEVIRSQPEGGFIFATAENDLCLNDNLLDIVDVSLIDEVGSNSAWIITDEAGLILDLPIAPPFDFSDAEEGVCFIYHLAYSNDVDGVEVGESLTNISGCYSLSNEVVVSRTNVDGGEVSLLNGENEIEICVGDMVADTIFFETTSLSNHDYQFVITDSSDKILMSVDTNFYDFEDSSIGVCRVYGLSYSGIPTILPGQNILETALSLECYDVSDIFIEVDRVEEGQACAGFSTMLMGEISYTIFPNPSSDELFIDIDRLPYPMGKIEVLNAYGKTIEIKDIGHQNMDRIPIDVSSYPNGIYLIRISSVGNFVSKQFVIE